MEREPSQHDALLDDKVVEEVDPYQASYVDPLDIYFEQMRQEPLLIAEQERSLGRAILEGKEATLQLRQLTELQAQLAPESPQSHNIVGEIAQLQEVADAAQTAREHLMRANTALVISIAIQYVGGRLPFPDLIQEGNVGLIRAVDKFDYRKGWKFSTYATGWIKQAIIRALSQKGYTIKVPVDVRQQIGKMYRVKKRLVQELGGEPTASQIASEMSVTEAVIEELIQFSLEVEELEKPLKTDDDRSLFEMVEDENAPRPEKVAFHGVLQAEIAKTLSSLTPRQAEILRLRFGLDGQDSHQVFEVAHKLNISPEAVRKSEADALNRLRLPKFSSHLKDFLEY